jgi:hypothetical protein
VKPHLSIAYQMQRLFAKLQTSSASAISTEGLTTSFGWDRSSVFTQQDVQGNHYLFCNLIMITTLA